MVEPNHGFPPKEKSEKTLDNVCNKEMSCKRQHC
jgi:hypothetical protein